MKEYHKIKWIYWFDANTKKPIAVIDDYFVPLANNQWIFTEKIDWTNIRVHRDWYKVSFWWRTENAQIPVRLLNRLQELFMEEIFEQTFGETSVTLYWEWYGGKIQHWIRDYKELEDFILFDINIGGIWLERKNIEDISIKLWIECVPIVLQWTLQEWVDFVKNSYVGKQWKQKEWLVGIPIWWFLDRQGKRIIVKIKQEHFKI